ncbi:hypothetical protein [Saccharothrix coeruleofusca]|uniref:Uncharacterized protein n=1 Tax=Saccharothrix coeruleofusca TaxID=33919 RepID=A0A918AIS0_9PSEU|nr:hypothetical protein [Saccharothrix coeruleofusca]MBP2334119.1 hypothetical protein [Saccharothrix coeruleofusca]GGP43318.1 hypothetical protein GCM10010185_13630 [Saccharothrix coeruleofusca]
MSRIQDLRDYYDSHDTSESMEEGQWEVDTVDDPMVTTSLRLPKSLLDWVRERANAEHMKPSAWIRTLLERARDGDGSLEQRVDVLEQAILTVVGQRVPPPPSRSTGSNRSGVEGRQKRQRASTGKFVKVVASGKTFKGKRMPEIAAGVLNKVATGDRLTPRAKARSK